MSGPGTENWKNELIYFLVKIIKSEIPDLLVIEPDIFEDTRGYFFESYNKKRFIEAGLDIPFVQDNESRSEFGVIRGLHYQLAPFAQSKLVRVIEGEIMDIAVDIRRKSPAFGKWSGMKLSAENKKQLFVPKGFAHGFSVLSKFAIVLYKCDTYYNPEAERGIIFNDPDLKIDWGLDQTKAIVTLKDQDHPLCREAEINYIYGNEQL